jgi:glutaminyl-tRNA synthetase
MAEDTGPTNFIRDLIAADIAAGKTKQVITRFPPEPNGYLHIGHAKAICTTFGAAIEFGGRYNLRFDDTNPVKEDVEFVEGIRRDIRWLGFDWGEHEYFASDYFEQLYAWAEYLVREGKAYVCDLTAEQMREYRGDFHTPGRDSPYRDRGVDENLDLFRRMRAGEFSDGARVLRAKIDMKHGNLNMRDPTMYRIKHAHHHRTGDAWCIYPSYDYAHGQSDAIEGITHSLCDLSFEDHRPLYDWFIANLPVPATPRQIEFARLNVDYTITSKRKLRRLVEEGHVRGWDDPRMPTLSGMRRRGYSPDSIRNFCDRIGVSKRSGVVDISLLEHAVRDDLNDHSPRVMAVLRPLELEIVNFPENDVIWFDTPLHPEDPSFGTRKVPLTRTIYIERDDFAKVPPKKWFRLALGAEIRLRYACLITCTDVIENADGEVIKLRCTWDPASRGGKSPDGRRVKGTSHWVSAAHAVPAEVRLYDRLFQVENPDAHEGDFIETLNPDSLEIVTGCRVEPSLAGSPPLHRVQFERLGYFCLDPDSDDQRLVFNRTIALKDTWAKIAKKQSAGVGK